MSDRPGEVCRRCGHTAGGCPRCDRVDARLGAAADEPLCHLFDDDGLSCYAIETVHGGVDPRTAGVSPGERLRELFAAVRAAVDRPAGLVWPDVRSLRAMDPWSGSWRWVRRDEDEPLRCPECWLIAVRAVSDRGCGPRTALRCEYGCSVRWRPGVRVLPTWRLVARMGRRRSLVD